MKKLKGLLSANGLKAMFVDHGEKIGFGVIGLVVLLLMSGSRWLPVEGTPLEILTKVEDGKRAIAANNWTEDKGEKYAAVNFVQESSRLRQPPSLQQFDFSTVLFSPLYRKQELAKEPELLPVESLIATAGRVILGKSIAPVGGESLAEGAMPGGSAVDGAASGLGFPGTAQPENRDDEFARRTTPGVGASGFPGAVGAPGAAHGAGGPGDLQGGAALPVAAGPMPGAAHGGPGGAMPEGGMMYGGMGMSGGPTMEPDGKSFIAVRGVWPIKDQLVKLQRALNLQSLNQASAYLNLIDFQLERQMAVAGTDAWSGPWEAVNVETLFEVLDQAADYGYDPVPPNVQDPVITCPLPIRLQGYWGDYATHWRIKNFQLSDAEMAREEAFLAKIREEYERTLAASPRRPEVKGFAGKGFASRNNDYRGMASMMMDYAAEDASYGNNMYSSMSSPMGMPGGGAMPGGSMAPGGGMMPGGVPMKPEEVKERLKQMTAAGTYVLFRYFDFDVRPGMAYRYRVKLKIENPNFERPVEQVVDQSITQGAERETPESNISNPAVTPDTVDYFVKDIRRDPIKDALGTASKRALAVLQMFEWDSAYGTVNADSINLTTLGQFIGETKKSLRLDVSKPSFKTEDVKFSSEDVFVDAIGDLELNPASHPDLKLGAKGHVGAPGEILVATEDGQLKTLDPSTRQKRRTDLEAFVNSQRKPYEDIKDKEDAPAGALDPLSGDYPGGSMSPEMMGMYGMDGGGGMPGGFGPGGKKPRKSRGGARGGSMGGP